jgi:hypothetical protein
MWAAMAAPEEPHKQPQPMNNWSSFFFFAAFVLVVAYTLLNLYIGESLQCWHSCYAPPSCLTCSCQLGCTLHSSCLCAYTSHMRWHYTTCTSV